MQINKEVLASFLLYSQPFQYEDVMLYPVCMDQVLDFLALSKSITIRKDSTFREKAIIKMTYLDFLVHCALHPELDEKYKIDSLHKYFQFTIYLLQMVCKNQEFKIVGGYLYINNMKITSEIFDDLRRIIILQNDIEFDIDEFIHHDTEIALQKAKDANNKNADEVTIEDYIDSLSIAIGYSEEQIMKMSIRKFWRYIKRYNLFENYQICKTAEQSGMVKYKEPIKYWITSIDEKDRYKDLKADEGTLRGKVG